MMNFVKKYNYIWDSHLNVFYQYDGKPWLENNITKAFIHTLESLKEKDEREFLSNLLDLTFPEGQFTIDCYLQSKPTKVEEMVKNLPEDKRYLFAFSPSGKSWTEGDIDGIDTKDFQKAKFGIEKSIRDQYSDLTEKELNIKIDEQWKDILKAREDTGFIPDAWIFISIDSKAYCVIILENKLFDLDPYQLNNHIEKSLFLKNNKPQPIYRKYQDIFDKLKSYDGEYLVNQFLGYLIILGYVDSSSISFEDAFKSDSIIKTRLINPWILNKIGNSIGINSTGDIDNRKRSKRTIRLKVNYTYLKEININLNEKDVELSLSFGSTMKTGRQMLDKLNLSKIQNLNQDRLYITFHISRHIHGSAPSIKESYVVNWKSISDYVTFLKSNTTFLNRQQTKKEILDLYYKIEQSGLISNFNYPQFINKLNQLSVNCSHFLVIPEITYSPVWSYDKIVELGENGFKQAMLETIKQSLTAFGLYNFIIYKIRY